MKEESTFEPEGTTHLNTTSIFFCQGQWYSCCSWSLNDDDDDGDDDDDDDHGDDDDNDDDQDDDANGEDNSMVV